jgi:hypothetical protein
MVAPPVAVGVYVTEQLADVAVAGRSVQLVALNVPARLDVMLTVPFGTVAPTPDVSFTVAVHIVEPLTATVGGEQLRLVLVDRGGRAGSGW